MLIRFLHPLADLMVGLTDFIYGPPEPGSNELLRRWLMENPDMTLSNYPTHT